jgi:AIPR protein
MQNRKTEIDIVTSDIQMKFVLVLAYSGTQPLSVEVKKPLEDAIASWNDREDVVSLEVLKQKELLDIVRQRVFGKSVNFSVLLKEWGKVSDPYKTFYGQLEVSDIVQWGKYGEFLYHKNIRGFKGSTDVNDAIVQTLKDKPEDFLYFNNGITLLCEKLVKQPLGGASRASGVFECEGVSVVNGAQTVGIVISAMSTNGPTPTTARVMIRLISLENCPPDFGYNVTRATNTQNRIEKKDFAALDKEQMRLKSDLFLSLQKDYVFKAGDTPPDPLHGCTLEDSTVALACANSDVTLCMIVKREMGKMYEDVDSPPYTIIFNPSLSAQKMWMAVEVLRFVDVTLKAIQALTDGKERLVAIHGNRLILHLVFRALGESAIADGSSDADFGTKIPQLTTEAFQKLFAEVEKSYSSSYPASLFKNVKKCKEIVAAIG